MLRFAVVALILVTGWGGCALVTVPEPSTGPTPLQPVWHEGELANHLRFFNSPEVEGRSTGRQGYARAAAYVAARMGEFSLQPVLHRSFRVLYHTSLNHVRSAVLATTERDTLFLMPGEDFLPDGRSDSGAVHIRQMVIDADGAAPGLPASAAGGEERAVLLSEQKGTGDYLQQLRAAGVRAVLVVGDLVLRPAAAPIRGLVAVQVTPEAAAHLLGMTPAEVEARVRGEGQPSRVLPQPVLLRVVAEHQRVAGAINTMGYIAGRHPVRARDLIVVCSDLDAVGQLGGLRTLDFRHFGTGTAALLELARNYASFTRLGNVPERTVLFAVWSGARLGHAGLREYLKNPSWTPERIRAVIYVGLQPEEEPAVRALLAEHGLPLYVVPSPEEPLFERSQATVPAEARRLRTAERLRRMTSAGPEPNLSEVFSRAVLAARDLAEEAHRVLLFEAVTPAPFRPVFDTLHVPVWVEQ